MHLAHEVVGFEHPAHAVGKREGDCHRQAFRYSNNYKSDSNHHRLQRMTQKRQPRGFICSGIKEMKNSDYHRKNTMTNAMMLVITLAVP